MNSIIVPTKRALILALLLVILGGTTAVHAGTIRLDHSLTKKQIGQNFEYLEDEKGEYSIRELLAGDHGDRWVASQKETGPGFGFTDSVYWVRFAVENTTDEDLPFFLEHSYPLIDDLQLFVPRSDGTVEVTRVGDRKP